MQSTEIEAKTVEEAISIACSKLNTTEDKLNVEILEHAHGKFRSFFSGKKAKIKASLKQSSSQTSEDAVGKLKEFLETIIKEIYHEAYIKVETEGEETVLNIIGDGSGIFIGKRGQTLEAFQYLINKIRVNKFRDFPHITVDSESYRSRHIDSLVSLAKRLSEKAKKRGGPVTTNLLNSGDRRIVHMTLKNDAELTTWSKGEGNLKKVIISPKQS
jgi:spoIIIJ-associated protein